MDLSELIRLNQAENRKTRIYAAGQSKPVYPVGASKVSTPSTTLRSLSVVPCKHGGTDKDIIERCPLCQDGTRHVRECEVHGRCTHLHVSPKVMDCLRCQREHLGFEPDVPDWRTVKGWFSLEEGHRYSAVLQGLRVPGAAVEIGVHQGRSTVLAATALIGTGRVLHCVDPWGEPDDVVEKQARKNLAPFGNTVKIHKGWSRGTAQQWKDGPVACVFIDGHHSYESCCTDIDSWLPRLSVGGIMCGHDYGSSEWPDVKRAVDERFNNVSVAGTFWWVHAVPWNKKVTIPQPLVINLQPAKDNPTSPDPIHFAPALTAQERGVLYALIRAVDEALTDRQHALCWGALLGYVRGGDLLQWDDDAEFICLDTPSIEDLRKRLPGLKVDEKQYITVSDPEFGPFPAVEINPAVVDGAYAVTKSAFNLPDDRFYLESLFPSRTGMLGQVPVEVPNDPKRIVTGKYGERCLHEALPPYWNHRYDRLTGFGGGSGFGTAVRTPLAEISKTSWIPKTFIINLDRRQDKWTLVHERMTAKKIDAERWPGVDGKAVGPVDYPGGRGAYGCLESHRRLLEKCLTEGIQSVMVFEDDVVPCENFHQRLADLFAVLPPDWDAVFLGGQVMGDIQHIHQGLARVTGTRGVHRTHAYIVRGSYIEKLYRTWSERRGHCDQIWGTIQREDQVYLAVPWLAGQADGFSDVSGRRNKERWWASQER